MNKNNKLDARAIIDCFPKIRRLDLVGLVRNRNSSNLSRSGSQTSNNDQQLQVDSRGESLETQRYFEFPKLQPDDEQFNE